ncbi:hypothetical protein [Sporocytophaga myxococcoides]|uniref:hypothetical protein n=1 Tax=Sporocytophaga myxococcoides TaxID=153721 RepID=UPI0012DFE8AF|nr:hypothetical protein [Sporocytophaga myxococcoides]
MNNKLSLLGALYFIIGIMYFYLRNLIPIELAWDWLRTIILISFLASPFVLGVSIAYWIPKRFQENKALGCIIPLMIFIFLIHNFIWTSFILWGYRYEDPDSSYPEKDDQKRKFTTQYIDKRPLGDHTKKLKDINFLLF